MAGGEIAKRQPRAEGDAGTRVGAGHQRIHVISHRVQPRDGFSFRVDDLRIGGGEDEFGRETAGRPVKAGLATSLGFGHVSGFVALVHPGAFEAAVAKADGEAALEAWRERANARLAAGQRHLEEGMMGRAALYEPIDNRRFREDGTKLADGNRYNGHEVEKAMLLNPDARLGQSGFFEA